MRTPSHEEKLEYINKGGDYSNKLRERFNAFLEASQKSEAQIAKAIGVSQTKLNQWRHGKYKVGLDALVSFESDVERYLNRDAARKSKKNHPYLATSIGKDIQGALHRCHTYCDMGVIYGKPGSGKTESVRYYKKMNPDVIWLTAHIGWNARTPLIHLCRELNLAMHGAERMTRIIRALKGTDRMIIIDEAQFLNIKCMELVRHIHDRAGIGIVYIGQPEIHRQMIGKDEEIFLQLFDRVGIRLELTAPTIEDVKLFAKERGVKDNKAIRYLYNITQDKYGSLRTVDKLLDWAVDYAELDNVQITVGLLKDVSLFRMV